MYSGLISISLPSQCEISVPLRIFRPVLHLRCLWKIYYINGTSGRSGKVGSSDFNANGTTGSSGTRGPSDFNTSGFWDMLLSWKPLTSTTPHNESASSPKTKYFFKVNTSFIFPLYNSYGIGCRTFKTRIDLGKRSAITPFPSLSAYCFLFS